MYATSGGMQFEHERNSTHRNQATLCRRNGTLLVLQELPKVKGEEKKGLMKTIKENK